MSTCKLISISVHVCTTGKYIFFLKSNVFKKRLHVNLILVICPAILEEKHKVVQGHFWLAIDLKRDIQENKILTLGYHAMNF